MEKQPDEPKEQEDAKILPFKRPVSEELARAILRHPAKGTEPIDMIIRRLDSNDEDDDDIADSVEE